MKPEGRTPTAVWLVSLIILVVYELWALATQPYEYTLTYPVRELIDQQPWVGGVLAAFLAWLGVHMIWERRKPPTGRGSERGRGDEGSTPSGGSKENKER